jgi:hypothetical protein
MSISVPVYWWFLMRQRRIMQRIGVGFLDTLAEQLGLTKVADKREPAAATAPAPADTKTAEQHTSQSAQ